MLLKVSQIAHGKSYESQRTLIRSSSTTTPEASRDRRTTTREASGDRQTATPDECSLTDELLCKISILLIAFTVVYRLIEPSHN